MTQIRKQNRRGKKRVLVEIIQPKSYFELIFHGRLDENVREIILHKLGCDEIRRKEAVARNHAELMQELTASSQYADRIWCKHPNRNRCRTLSAKAANPDLKKWTCADLRKELGSRDCGHCFVHSMKKPQLVEELERYRRMHTCEASNCLRQRFYTEIDGRPRALCTFAWEKIQHHMQNDIAVLLPNGRRRFTQQAYSPEHLRRLDALILNIREQ